jgi:alkanesulfonate monooxygenase SsuD/methylene tetrahydromethanopterin reductase-like flavin-dependent oxidoreductase (luciferase family)
LRRAAELGDAWHPVGAIPAAPLEPDELADNVRAMRAHAQRVGRDADRIQVSMKAPLYDASIDRAGDQRGGQEGPRRRFSGSPEDVLDDIHAYAEAGATHLIFDFRSPFHNETEERMSRFAEEVMAAA